ncbi:stAR-related lipid transfer protein 5-like [Glandiceps talaboti]
MNFKVIADDTVTKLLHYEGSVNDWKHYKTKNGVKMSYRKSLEMYDGYIYKCEYILDASLERVSDFSLDRTKQLQWNTGVNQLDLIETVDEHTDIVRSVSPTYMMGMISPREFIDLIGVRELPDSDRVILFFVSVEHPKCSAVPKGMVRGIDHPSGSFLSSVEGDHMKTKVISFIQFDYKLSSKTLSDQTSPMGIFDYIRDLKRGLKTMK